MEHLPRQVVLDAVESKAICGTRKNVTAVPVGFVGTPGGRWCRLADLDVAECHALRAYATQSTYVRVGK